MPIKIGQWLRWLMQMEAWANNSLATDKFPILTLLKQDCEKCIKGHPNC